MAEDISSIKSEIKELKDEIYELRNVRKGYIKKLKRLDKKGKFTSYKNVKELRKEIEMI
jgi:predicted RNase H-like nuclease (RuvC/YqgF family)